jgi:hypothetical protein
MSNITKSDLKSFSKVLSVLGEQLSKNTDEFLRLINSFESKNK